MKNHRFSFLALLILSMVWLLNFRGLAQWMQTNGPNTGNILSLSNGISNHLFVGTKREGIFRSEDWVGSYSRLPTYGLSDSIINGIIEDQSGHLFIATSNGAYILNPPGTMWDLTGLSGMNVSSLSLGGDNFLWAATSTGVYTYKYGVFPWSGIFAVDTVFHLVSHDNTNPINYEMPSTLTNVKCVIPGFACDGFRLYRYNGFRQNWQVCTYPVGFGLNQVFAQIVAQNGNFIMTDHFISEDFGNTWTEMNNFPHLQPKSLKIIGSKIYASGENGVYVSSNHGTTWTAINNDLSNRNVVCLTASGFSGTQIHAGTLGGGIFKYDDMLNKWEPIGVSSYARINCLGAFGHDMYAGLINQYPGIYVAKNSQYGINWACKTGGIPPSGLFVNTFAFMDTGDVVLAGSHLGIYRSGDRGETWTVEGNSASVPSQFIASKGTRAVAGGGFQVYYSNDNGIGWGNVTNNLSSLGLSIRDGVFDQMGNIFLATSGGVYISSDDGATWAHRGLSSAFKIAARGSRLFAGSYGSILTSDNYGNNWVSHIVDQSNLNQVMAIVPAGNFIFSAIGKKVYYSEDNGNTWAPFGTPLSSDVSSIAINDTILVAGTRNHGIWKCRIGSVTEKYPLVSQEANLQVYPNPGKRCITVEFPGGGLDEISVYSIAGTKVNENINTQDFSKMEFQLNPGIYFVKAKAGNRYFSKKIAIE